MQFPDRRALADHMLGSEEYRRRTQAPPALADDQVYAGYAPHELALFEQFPSYDGPGSPGFVTNFLGVRVRTSFSTPLRCFDGHVEGYPMPVGGVQGETAEFIGMLRSVLDAKDRYTLLECGAGYGTWMAMAAAAATRRGISDLRLYGIEGDAGYSKFMSEHLDDNGVNLENRTLIHGAVGARAGTARWAMVDSAADVYGGRPMDDGLTDYHGAPQFRLADVQVDSINDLLQREPVWDLVHVDIQGGEGALCRAGIEAMNQCVRRVVIGTHSRALDGDAMSVIHAADWTLENEKPTIMVWRDGAPTLETMARVDGVQVWRNPRLASVPSV